jgi:hypothetical protein
MYVTASVFRGCATQHKTIVMERTVEAFANDFEEQSSPLNQITHRHSKMDNQVEKMITPGIQSIHGIVECRYSMTGRIPDSI